MRELLSARGDHVDVIFLEMATFEAAVAPRQVVVEQSLCVWV